MAVREILECHLYTSTCHMFVALNYSHQAHVVQFSSKAMIIFII